MLSFCRWLTILFCVCGAFMAFGADRLSLFVTIAPQREIVERVAGEEAQVEVLVPPGMSPENFSPGARTLNSLAEADCFFTIGVESEEAVMPKLRRLNPAMRVVAPAGLRYLDFPPPGDGRDPHVWLAVDNLMLLARQCAETLGSLRPAHLAVFRERAERYCRELAALDQEIAALLAPLRGRTVLVFHPAFGYFLERYGLQQLPVELEGKEPPGGYLMQTMRRAKREKCPALFVQPQMNPRSVKTVSSELDCAVVQLDPLPLSISGGLRQIARAVAQSYSAAVEEP